MRLDRLREQTLAIIRDTTDGFPYTLIDTFLNEAYNIFYSVINGDWKFRKYTISFTSPIVSAASNGNSKALTLDSTASLKPGFIIGINVRNNVIWRRVEKIDSSTQISLDREPYIDVPKDSKISLRGFNIPRYVEILNCTFYLNNGVEEQITTLERGLGNRILKANAVGEPTRYVTRQDEFRTIYSDLTLANNSTPKVGMLSDQIPTNDNWLKGYLFYNKRGYSSEIDKVLSDMSNVAVYLLNPIPSQTSGDKIDIYCHNPILMLYPALESASKCRIEFEYFSAEKHQMDPGYNQIPLIPRRYHFALCAWAAAQCYILDGKIQEANIWLEFFRSQLVLANHEMGNIFYNDGIIVHKKDAL